ncbi:MAG: M48 family metalloprotease [Rhizobiales bacterium]|nr:M48 family metalloprotease [Hyphomicrobiales bacterium]MBO6913902.1 M48 family metalloprotease [Hyphomicrobiales bacterium]MBO6955605.1 M48 family metalloprotease [Hyphomicrobiales bacterium]
MTLFADTHPIHQHLNHFARQLDLPRIKWVGWFPDDSINAFAMGLKQDEALVAFSSGAINKLTKDEMQAVMAHELAHIANHDMARMTYAVAVQDALTWFLRWRGLKQFARWVFTPLSELELMRMSRRREYWADAIGARLVSPEAMAGALRKTSALKTNSKAAADFRHFMLNADASSFFASHPTTKQRIEAIERRMFINRLPETGVASSDVDLGGVAARLKTWVYRRFNEPPHKPS